MGEKGAAVGTLDRSAMADSDLGPETLRTALIKAPVMSKMNTDEDFYMPKAFCESEIEINIPEKNIPAGFQVDNRMVFSLWKPVNVIGLVCYKTESRQLASVIWTEITEMENIQ